MTTIIDNAINPRLVWGALANYPDSDWDGWHYYNDFYARKYGQKPNVELNPIFHECISAMIRRASQTIGAECFPDLSLYGAGLHKLEAGGYLHRHRDASLHAEHGWKREWSVILYLNPAWEKSDGGRFGMTHSLNENCDSSETQWTAPLFNRMTMFRTNEKARHEVEQYSGSTPRMSIALFFFSLKEPRKPLRHKAQFDPINI